MSDQPGQLTPQIEERETVNNEIQAEAASPYGKGENLNPHAAI